MGRWWGGLFDSDGALDELCLFVGKCMEVGAKITKDQIGDMKRTCKKAELGYMDFGMQQIGLALKEYKSGEPYQLREVDIDGNLCKVLQVTIHSFIKTRSYYSRSEDGDDSPAGEEEADKLEGENKHKTSGEDTEDLGEPATKQTKVEKVIPTA